MNIRNDYKYHRDGGPPVGQREAHCTAGFSSVARRLVKLLTFSSGNRKRQANHNSLNAHPTVYSDIAATMDAANPIFIYFPKCNAMHLS